MVRASDIGAWMFCRRAWWLANVKKLSPTNNAALAHGNESHRVHGKLVERSFRLRRAGMVLVLLGILFLALLLFWLVFVQASEGQR